MAAIRGFVDPRNASNVFIFGSSQSDECYYLKKDTKNQTMKYQHFTDIPKDTNQKSVMSHECCVFAIENNNKNSKDYYALVYGGGDKFFGASHAHYQIYEFKENVNDTINGNWNDYIQVCNNKWFNNEYIMKHGNSKCGFGQGLAMLTDLFDPSIIHIPGGYGSYEKYGYFKMTDQCLNADSKMS